MIRARWDFMIRSAIDTSEKRQSTTHRALPRIGFPDWRVSRAQSRGANIQHSDIGKWNKGGVLATPNHRTRLHTSTLQRCSFGADRRHVLTNVVLGYCVICR